MPKVKVSVTIEETVLERIDRVAGGRPRSEVFERALKRWLNDRRRLELEEQIAAYYADRHEEESADDREWADLGASQLRKTWS